MRRDTRARRHLHVLADRRAIRGARGRDTDSVRRSHSCDQPDTHAESFAESLAETYRGDARADRPSKAR